jgi:hypothetical protein
MFRRLIDRRAVNLNRPTIRNAVDEGAGNAGAAVA